jgi:hypothetical protein
MSARSVQIDVLAGSDALAHRHYRIVGALSCNPQVDHERVQRPHPQVVGLPPPDLAKQVGIDTARIIAAARIAYRWCDAALRVCVRRSGR